MNLASLVSVAPWRWPRWGAGGLLAAALACGLLIAVQAGAVPVTLADWLAPFQARDAALSGGAYVLLLLADTLARTVAIPAEVPVGIFTALLGGPFFLMLLRRFRHASA
ncbi:hypothetical protein CSZ94_21525 [Janthinobacterium sp. ROICE36]|uniref:iron chelate uptake ABC transporter family permease subunit n=1 Tax=Janthinobacterium sp. ROICE36 TaxID=2048670 RepID=UPI000C7EB0FB|nr:iron chelate uptake ABC transporter family permease subunit [Janthinobacterium sp. ROICE36]PLY40314.1 hypothetical protein CSZ94_21525 [Janthinobacterium sp. ROICE36]